MEKLTIQRAYEIKDKIQDLRETIKQLIKSADIQEKEFRKVCPHTDSSYQSDPSGNNDSGFVCNICGAYSKRGWASS